MDKTSDHAQWKALQQQWRDSKCRNSMQAREVAARFLEDQRRDQGRDDLTLEALVDSEHQNVATTTSGVIMETLGLRRGGLSRQKSEHIRPSQKRLSVSPPRARRRVSLSGMIIPNNTSTRMLQENSTDLLLMDRKSTHSSHSRPSSSSAAPDRRGCSEMRRSRFWARKVGSSTRSLISDSGSQISQVSDDQTNLAAITFNNGDDSSQELSNDEADKTEQEARRSPVVSARRMSINRCIEIAFSNNPSSHLGIDQQQKKKECLEELSNIEVGVAVAPLSAGKKDDNMTSSSDDMDSDEVSFADDDSERLHFKNMNESIDLNESAIERMLLADDGQNGRLLS